MNKENLAQTYEKVFAGPPWNEFKVCTGDGCGKSFGLESQGQDACPCDKKSMLSAFYPRVETLASISKEIEQEGAKVEVKYGPNGEIIGFVWGYPTTSERFTAEKYKTDEGRSQMQSLLSSEGISENFFYFSETGVIPEFRGRGLSNEFAKIMVDAAFNTDLPLVMRTNWQSPMVAVARRYGMDQIMGPRSVVRNGEIISTGEIINMKDPENVERVLFTKTIVKRG